MDTFEISTEQTPGFQTGVSDAGVNYLQPTDAYQNMIDGFIYRQVLQSRQGFSRFCPRLDPGIDVASRRVLGIFEHFTPAGVEESLVIDANFVYKYNQGTGIYDLIPFGGSLVGLNATGMMILNNDEYISGASYPAKSNSGRFVFAGKGLGGIYFYDDASNTVLDFTNAGDNPDYAAPPEGALTAAYFVLWFNGRINFVRPTINSIQYNQQVLYSGIRAQSGNGDKFNVPGSGRIGADTYEDCTGATICGNYIFLNFTRSNWTLEKTPDAFNPYFIRKVPGVEGTNADFSAVSWADIVKSLGRTGVIQTNGRKTLRVDNKIPNFTTDEISAKYFQTTYGGFDRINNQFLWSYIQAQALDGVDPLTTQNQCLINNYEFDTWAVFDWRFSCFGQTFLGRDLTWDDIEASDEHPSWGAWETTEETWNTIGIGEAVQKTLAGDHFGYIYQLNTGLNDYASMISAITNASAAQVTVDQIGFVVGDEVVIENVEGMTEINNYDPAVDQPGFTPYTITAITDNVITLNVDSSEMGTYTTGGTLSKIINFSAQTIPFNPYREDGYRVYISHVDFYIECTGGFLYVDVYEDQNPLPIIQDTLLQPISTNNVGEWVSMSVNNEANFMTFTLKQKSPSAQLRITSMRIYCSMGGSTTS